MSSIGGVFLKAGAVKISHDQGFLYAALQAASEWRIYSGVILYIVPVAIWIYLLKRLNITFLQPLFSMVYIFTPLLAATYLNENIPTARWFGIGIIVVGIIISSRA